MLGLISKFSKKHCFEEFEEEFYKCFMFNKKVAEILVLENKGMVEWDYETSIFLVLFLLILMMVMDTWTLFK